MRNLCIYPGQQVVSKGIEDEAIKMAKSGESVLIRILAKGEWYRVRHDGKVERRVHGQDDGINCQNSGEVKIAE